MTSGISILPFERPTPFSPPAAYEELHRDAPIARVLTAHGESAWMVTGWEGVKQVLSDPRWGVTPPDADPAHRLTVLRRRGPRPAPSARVPRVHRPRPGRPSPARP